MNRAQKWAHAKTAGYFMPGGNTPQTAYSPYATDSTVSSLMASHFPVAYGRDIIRSAPNVSFEDRVRLLGALNSSADRHGPEATTTSFADFLPAAVGAGLGLMGAALTAPIFGFTPVQKKMYGIGAGALGAVLNTYGRN